MELKVNKWTVLLAIVSLSAGFFLNWLANNIANKKLLEQIKAEIAIINQKQRQGRTSPEESVLLERRKSELEAQINILSKK